MSTIEHTPTMPVLAGYLTRDQLARELNLTTRTLARWKWHRKGPPSVLVGGRRLYRRESVLKWLDAQTEAAA